MSYAHHLTTLSGNDKNNLQSCLDKLDKRQNPSSSEAKNCSLAISKLNKVITDKPLIDHFVKLLSTAFQLNSQETDVLKRLIQSSRTMSALTNDTEYLTIIKIAKNLQNYHQRFRPMPNLNSFFNLLHSDKAFESIIGIIKAANLSDALAIELLKAQYKSSYTVSFRTAELTTQINKAGKLSALPDKAFDRLAERFIENINKEISNQQDKIADAGKKDIFKKILKNQNVADSEAKKLITIYQLLSAVNKTSILPNQVADKLQQLDKNRISKQKSSTPFNVQELLKKLNKPAMLTSSNPLTPFQALYLHGYVTKSNLEIPPSERIRLDKALQKIPSNLLARAKDYRDEFIDSKTIKTIAEVVEQIRREEKRLSDDGIYVPELGITLKLASNFLEIRPTKNAQAIFAPIINQLLKNPSADVKNIGFETEILRYHEGVDFTARGNNSGILSYKYGFKIKPTIAKLWKDVLDTSTDSLKARNSRNITILEYHPEHGILQTTFRHVQKVFVKVGDDLTNHLDKPIGSYAFQPEFLSDEITDGETESPRTKQKNLINNGGDYTKLIKEHVHIERQFADKSKLNALTEQEWNKQLKSISRANTQNEATAAVTKQAKIVQPMIDGDDYHAIALLTPGDPLNTQFLNDMQRNWVSNVADLIKGGKIKTDDREAAIKQIYAYLATSHVRDHLMLETIIQLLNKVKFLLAQIGKTNSELENLITTTTQVAKKLKLLQKFPDKFKLKN